MYPLMLALFALLDYFIKTRTIPTVRRSHNLNCSLCSNNSNCSHCSLFWKNWCALFAPNSANERTTNTYVLSSLNPGICTPVFVAKIKTQKIYNWNRKSSSFVKSEKKIQNFFLIDEEERSDRYRAWYLIKIGQKWLISKRLPTLFWKYILTFFDINGLSRT